MFELKPSYLYKIRQPLGEGITYTQANLTRGVFNVSHTGKFIAYEYMTNPSDVYILCQCQKPECDNRPFWDSLSNIQESGIAHCQICDNPVTVCETGKPWKDKNMTHDEMRFIRRELINRCLHGSYRRLSTIKNIVRILENYHHGQELNLYK